MLLISADEPYAAIKTKDGLVHAGPGENIEVRCENEGNPSVTVIWKHDGANIDFSSRKNVRMSHLAGGLPEETRLEFRPLKAEDFGSYLCFVNNTLGQKEAEVKITGK